MKIRKIEVTPEEFFEALNDILIIDEKVPQNLYLGSDLNYICKSLGIKPLEFWALKFKFEKSFEKSFVVSKVGPDPGVFSLWRKERHEMMPK